MLLTISTSTATVPYEILNSFSPLITLMKKMAIGAYSAICKIELTTTIIALKDADGNQLPTKAMKGNRKQTHQ